MATSKGTGNPEASLNVKYSVLPTKDATAEDEHRVEVSEEMSLLDNMENVHISDAQTKSTDDNTTEKQTSFGPTLSTEDGNDERKSYAVQAENDDDDAKKKDNMDTEKAIRENTADDSGKQKEPESGNTETDSKATDTDTKLDIVRKMSKPAPASTDYIPWQQIGLYSLLTQKSCQRIYAKSGRSDDLALFHVNGKFHIMEAWCSHMGGPLFEGDIEDYNGQCHVMCPWHSYMFDLRTGRNEIGLQQKVYDLKLENAYVYVRYQSEVSVHPTRKASEARNPRVIQPPNKNSSKHGKPTRKDSVLESVMRLA